MSWPRIATAAGVCLTLVTVTSQTSQASQVRPHTYTVSMQDGTSADAAADRVATRTSPCPSPHGPPAREER